MIARSDRIQPLKIADIIESKNVKQLSKAIADLIVASIQNAQNAGDLPAFELPDIRVEAPKREGQGDYAFPAMQLSKLGKKNPRAIAEDIVNHLPEADFLEKTEIAGPGFINFFLSDDYLKNQVETIISEGDGLFTLDIGAGKKAQVEFVSANPTGPIHVGRTRGGVIGDSMARVLGAAGYEVQREYYFNNAGNQMVMLGESLKVRYLQALGDDIELDDNHYQGDYLIDYAKEIIEAHRDSWRGKEWRDFKEFAEEKMFGWIKESLKAIDIEHDNFFNEDSLFQNEEVWQTLAELKENGYVYEAVHWHGATEEEIENPMLLKQRTGSQPLNLATIKTV